MFRLSFILVLFSSSTWSDTVVQSDMFYKLYQTKVVEHIANNGHLRAIYFKNFRTKVQTQIVIESVTRESHNSSITFLGFDYPPYRVNIFSRQQESEVSLRLDRIHTLTDFLSVNGLIPETIYILYDTSRHSTELSSIYSHELRSRYNIVLMLVRTEHQLKQAVSSMRGSSNIYINLVMNAIHTESNTYLSYKESVRLAQRWNVRNLLDVGLIQNSGICLCISYKTLAEVILRRENSDIEPTIYLNAVVLDGLNSTLHLNNVRDTNVTVVFK